MGLENITLKQLVEHRPDLIRQIAEQHGLTDRVETYLMDRDISFAHLSEPHDAEQLYEAARDKFVAVVKGTEGGEMEIRDTAEAFLKAVKGS
jgi:hypothetical protein